MKLIGKMYKSTFGAFYLRAREDNRIYRIHPDGRRELTDFTLPLASWKLIGDSYAES